MDARSKLITVIEPTRPDGVVVLVHGGGSRRGNMMVSPTQLSVLRMIPIGHRVRKAGAGRMAIYRLLNSTRGWDTRHTPVDDVRWGLNELRSKWGGHIRVCLIGHSLGGRAAILAADDPDVIAAVALAPWIHPSDGELALPGRRILFVHGSEDRIASPQNSVAAAQALSRTADVGYIRIAGGKHAMLRHHRLFDGLAADFAAVTLLGTEPVTPLAELRPERRWLEI